MKRCSLSSAVSRTSAGALEMMPIYVAEDLRNLILDAKKSGWTVAALDEQTENYEKEIQLSKIAKLDKKTIFVIGSEKSGISEEMIELSNYNVKIAPNKPDLKFPETLVNSLSVSMSSAVLFNHLARLNEEQNNEIHK